CVSSEMIVIQTNQDRDIKMARGLATSEQHPSIQKTLYNYPAQWQRARHRSAECSFPFQSSVHCLTISSRQTRPPHKDPGHARERLRRRPRPLTASLRHSTRLQGGRGLASCARTMLVGRCGPG
ncbi:MAG: hypothetical protein ACK56F_21900, partial [bacterium]